MEIVYKGSLLDVYSSDQWIMVGTKNIPILQDTTRKEMEDVYIRRVKTLEEKYWNLTKILKADQTIELDWVGQVFPCLYVRTGKDKVLGSEYKEEDYYESTEEERKELLELTDFRDCVVWMKGMFKFYNTTVISSGQVRGSVGPELRVVRIIDKGMITVNINDVQVALIPQGNYFGNISIEEKKVKGVLKCAKIASMVLDEVRQRATGEVDFTIGSEGISITVGGIEKFRVDLTGRVTYVRGLRMITKEIDLSEIGRTKNYFTFLEEIQWMFEDIRTTLLWTGPEKPGVIDFIKHGLESEEEWIYKGSLFDITEGSIGNYVY